MIRVLYFASLREAVGIGSEELELPEDASVGGLIDVLAQRDGPWAEAFSGRYPVLKSVNQEMARNQDPIEDGDEIGFFPPVTGG